MSGKSSARIAPHAVPSGVVAAGVQQRMAERRRVILTPSREPVSVLAPHDARVRVRTTTTVAAMEGIEELRIVAQDPGLLLERGPTRRRRRKPNWHWSKRALYVPGRVTTACVESSFQLDAPAGCSCANERPAVCWTLLHV